MRIKQFYNKVTEHYQSHLLMPYATKLLDIPSSRMELKNGDFCVIGNQIIWIKFDINQFKKEDEILQVYFYFAITPRPNTRNYHLDVYQASKELNDNFGHIYDVTDFQYDLLVGSPIAIFEYQLEDAPYIMQDAIDITKLMNEALRKKESSFTIGIKVTGDEFDFSDLQNANPEMIGLSGVFYNNYQSNELYDVHSIGDGGTGIVDLVTKEFLYTTPQFTSNDNIFPIQFYAMYKQGLSSVLGENFGCSLDSTMTKTYIPSSSLSSRITITDYRGVNYHYFLLTDEERREENITKPVVIGEAYYSLTDDSYVVVNNNQIIRHFVDDTEIEYFYYPQTNRLKIMKMYQVPKDDTHTLIRQIHYIWNEKNQLVKITNSLGSEFQIDYIGNEISRITIPKERKMISFSYIYYNQKAYLATLNFDIYGQTMNIRFKTLLRMEYIYSSNDNHYLESIQDVYNDVKYEYNYKSTQVMPTPISWIKLTTGLTGYKKYQYTSLEGGDKTICIEDQFSNKKVILTDVYNHLKTMVDKDKNFLVFSYQMSKGKKGLPTQKVTKRKFLPKVTNLLMNTDYTELNSSNLPLYWEFNTQSQIIVSNETLLPDFLNPQSLVFVNTQNKEQQTRLSQTIEKEGFENEEWEYSLWLQTIFTENTTLKVKIECYYKNNEQPTIYEFEPNCEDNHYQLCSGGFITTDRYYKMCFVIEFHGDGNLKINRITLTNTKKPTITEVSQSADTEEYTENNQFVQYNYDQYHRIQSVKSSGGDFTHYNYTHDNLVVKESNDTNNECKTYTYNDLNQCIQQEECYNDYPKTIRTFAYDTNHNLLAVQDKDVEYFYRYDTNHNLIESLEKDGITSTYQYDSYNRMKEIKTFLNQRCEKVNFLYQHPNLLKSVTVNSETPSGQGYIYEYDSQRRLNKVSLDGINLFSCEYHHSIGDYLTDIITKKSFGSNYYVFEYLQNKRLLEKVKYNGTTNSHIIYDFTYDEKERLIQSKCYESSKITNYQYEEDALVDVEIKKDEDNTIEDHYSYAYDQQNNLQQSRIQHCADTKVYNYEYVNETAEYSLKGYFGRMMKNHLDDILIANAYGELMYGNPSDLKCFHLIYDEKIKQNIMCFDTTNATLQYLTSSVNCKRIAKKIYRNQIYTWEDWKDKFTNRKCISTWIKVVGNYTSELKVLNFGNHSQCFYSVCIINNGELVLKTNAQVFHSNIYVSSDEWSLVCVILEKDSIVLGVNDCFSSEFLNIDSKVEDITKVCFGNYFDYTISEEELNQNKGEPLECYLCYLSATLGLYLQRKDIIQDYKEGIQYLSGKKINKTNAVVYYNQDLYRGMEVFTLRGSFISSKGTKPKDYIYHQHNYQFDKTNLFKYDEMLHHHVYESSKGVSPIYKSSLLEYQRVISSTETISIWAKLHSENTEQDRFILSWHQENSSVCYGLCISSNHELCFVKYTNYVCNYYRTNIIIKDNVWNLYTIHLDGNSIYIKINQRPYKKIDTTLEFITDVYRIRVGSGFLGSTVSHLNGYLEMLAFSDGLVSSERINDIYNHGRCIFVSKEYDDYDRIKNQIVYIKNKEWKTMYRYYENVAINVLPTSEVLPNYDEIIYAYDINHQITNKIKLNKDGDFLEGYQYLYDEFRRLKEETRYQENNIFDYCFQYAYDDCGNILTKTSLDENHNTIYKDTYIYPNYTCRLEQIVRNKDNIDTIIYNICYNKTVLGSEDTYMIKEIEKNGICNEVVYVGNQIVEYGNHLYQYNERGIRISDTTKDTKTVFSIEGDRIVRTVKTTATETITIDYHYERNGMVCGFHYQGKEYIYERDITGNINAIIDEEGRTVVRYQYTAYGIPTIIESIDIEESKEISENNIFLYKGYCYDRETHLYWVSSRYYSPELCRFISPDDVSYLDPTSINGLNLYAYCGNDPINKYDPTGHFPWLVLAAVVVALFTPIGGIVTQAVASAIGYVVTAGWAVGDLIFNNGDGAWSDMCSIKWNPFNKNASITANSNYVSFYKGMPVFKTNGSSGSFGAIFLTRNEFTGTSGHYWTQEDILKHEYGHGIQQLTYGPIAYLYNIGIPSAFIDNADNAPWEITADKLGEVDRPYNANDTRKGWNYFGWGRIVGPFWWW